MANLMRWIEPKRSPAPVPAPDIALLEAAVAARPEAAALHNRLGTAWFHRLENARAVASFAEAERLDAQGFRAWEAFAAALLALGRAEETLALCDRGLARGAADTLRHYRGLALRRLGRRAEGNADLERALNTGPRQFHTLKALLQPLATDADGRPLLDYCDTLPPAYRDTAGARAYRAIALSRIGRTEEANALVDLDHHIALVPFEPAGGIEGFNRILAEEIVRTPPPGAKRDGFEIAYGATGEDNPAFAALSAFTRAAIDRYIADFPAMGLSKVMPPPPATASLGRATGILRRDGSNGEHIHAGNYVSSVYYVQVPDSIRDAEDGRGTLLMGKCTHHTRGYQACWGTRHIKPQPGMLAIFPSHVFHDVVPSLSEEPRIVVAADLRPEAV